jgi:hypothetical protein
MLLALDPDPALKPPTWRAASIQMGVHARAKGAVGLRGGGDWQEGGVAAKARGRGRKRNSSSGAALAAAVNWKSATPPSAEPAASMLREGESASAVTAAPAKGFEAARRTSADEDDTRAEKDKEEGEGAAPPLAFVIASRAVSTPTSTTTPSAKPTRKVL